MQRRIGIGLGLAVVAAMALWLTLDGSERGAPPVAPRPSVESARAPERRAELGTTATRETREPEEGAAPAREVAAPSAASSSKGPPARGTILGQVVDTAGVPVPVAKVKLERSTREIRTDASGRFEVADLEPGRYRLEVLPEGLPAGLVPAWDGAWPELTDVEVPEAGGSVKAFLVVAEVARVSGRVVDTDGRPVPAFAVRVQSAEHPWHTSDTWTDAEGRFRFERVWPGECALEVWAQPASELHSLPRPRRAFGVAPGEALELPDVAYARGPCALTGRVIDQDDRAVGGIAIVCGSATTGTDADGRFLFEALFPASYDLWIGPSGTVGYRAVFADPSWWASLKVDLTASPARLDLGTIPIRRDRLFTVNGRLECGDARELGTLFLEVAQLANAPGQALVSEERVRFDRTTGAFEFHCLPSEEIRELQFVVTRGPTELARVPVRPVADESVELVIPVR